MKDSGIVLKGQIQGILPPDDKGNYKLQILVREGNFSALHTVKTKTNGQSVGDMYSGMVAISTFNGKFYGFRAV